jgi:hypothetical protein
MEAKSDIQEINVLDGWPICETTSSSQRQVPAGAGRDIQPVHSGLFIPATYDEFVEITDAHSVLPNFPCWHNSSMPSNPSVVIHKREYCAHVCSWLTGAIQAP